MPLGAAGVTGEREPANEAAAGFHAGERDFTRGAEAGDSGLPAILSERT